MLWDGPLVYAEDEFKEYIGQWSNPCQSWTIQCQFQANSWPIVELTKSGQSTSPGVNIGPI